MSVVVAVRAELEALGEPACSSALAASALALADRLDATGSARDIAAVAHELRDTLAEIEKRYPRQQQEDEVDRLRRERALRLAR
jgi:hypothetical protein